MTSSQGTLIQRWNSSCTVGVAILVICLHVSAFAIAAYLCPELFTARSYEGAHCQPSGDTALLTNDECDTLASVGGGQCLPRDSGDVVKMRDIRMTYRFPGDRPDDQLSVWSWRLVGSIAISLTMVQPHTMVANMSAQEVSLSASIDYAPLQYLTHDTDTGCVTSSAWHSRASVVNVNRTLDCRRTRQGQDWELSSDVDMVCSLHPFFELMVLSNASYIVQVQLSPAAHGQEMSLVDTNVSVTSYLTLVRETDSYHRTHFYAKCLFTPLLIMSLVWFMVRLCLNDLYVTIHDRLLITAALAQV